LGHQEIRSRYRLLPHHENQGRQPNPTISATPSSRSTLTVPTKLSQVGYDTGVFDGLAKFDAAAKTGWEEPR
jgi:hypothetical protein